MGAPRLDRPVAKVAILVAIVAVPFVAVGFWKLHTRGEESTARAEARSVLPADAHVISERAQSCGSDAGAAHECILIAFQLDGSITQQADAFTAQAQVRGWQEFSRSRSPGAYSLVFVKPPQRIDVTLHDPASPACHSVGSPGDSCVNTLSRSPGGGYPPAP